MSDRSVRACGACRFYQWGTCNLVEGSIEATDVCDLYLPGVQTWLPTPSLYSAAASKDAGGAWRLFNELPRAFADAPEWVNILPIPGTYSHPGYGTILITAERNTRFKDNFDARVYQQDLPITIDIEHDESRSGAVGYFEELRVNDDGSVDAKVNWTGRGLSLIDEDAFKYFSPEWWDVWTDPATGTAFQDVLVGGAICVRPFFKEGALRPLVASEHRLVAAGELSADHTTIWMQPVAAVRHEDRLGRSEEVHVDTSKQLTEDEIKEFRELKAKDAERDQKLAATEAEVAVLKTDAQRQRFTDLVMGRGKEGDGAVWAGGIEENVASLQRIATALGEDSDEFRAEVALRRQTAKTLKESGIFTSIGSGDGGEGGGDETSKADAKARLLMANDPKLDYAAALNQVFAEDPGLYDAHRRASVSRLSVE